jgi:hypothetical protein
LLPVPYFHLVFTLPAALGPLALQNPRVVYGLLLQAAAQTLLEVAANPQHLGAEIGCLVVLHAWHPTALVGFGLGQISSCRSASSAACSGASSLTG